MRDDNITIRYQCIVQVVTVLLILTLAAGTVGAASVDKSSAAGVSTDDVFSSNNFTHGNIGYSSEKQPLFPTLEPLSIQYSNSNSDNIGLNEKHPADPENQNLVVILVDFADTSHTYGTDRFEELYFDDDTTNNVHSVREYYQEVSDQKLDYTSGSGVIGWIESSYTLESAQDHSRHGSSLKREFIRDTLEKANNRNSLDQYSDGNNEVKAIIVHQGPEGQAQRGYPDSEADPHADISVPSSPVTVHGYTVVPETANGGIAPIGSVAHEMGHIMHGWGDVYIVDGERGPPDIQGSEWVLMGSGDIGGPQSADSTSPVHPQAWRKVQAGWGTAPELSSSQPGILPPASRVNDFYTEPNANSGEKTYLSFRPPEGFDQGLNGVFNKYGDSPNYFSDVDENRVDKFIGLTKWTTNVNIPGGADGVDSGGKIAHTLTYPGSDNNIEYKYNSLLVNVEKSVQKDGKERITGPEKRSLGDGQKAAYAVDMSNIGGGAPQLDSRVSWSESGSDMNVRLVHNTPGGATERITSQETDITYESAQASVTNSERGWAIYENTSNAVTYFSATNYPRDPLPTRLEFSSRKSQYSAVTGDIPGRISVDLEVYNGNKSYDLNEVDQSQLNINIGDTAVDKDTIRIPDDSVDKNKMTVSFIPPVKSRAGTYPLTIAFEDEKHRVEHMTDLLSGSVVYSTPGPRFRVSIENPGETYTNDVLTVYGTIENTGTAGAEDVTLDVSNVDERTTRTISLDSGESSRKSFTMSTDWWDVGSYTATLSSADYTSNPVSFNVQKTWFQYIIDGITTVDGGGVLGIEDYPGVGGLSGSNPSTSHTVTDNQQVNENSLQLQEAATAESETLPQIPTGETVGARIVITNPEDSMLNETVNLHVPGLGGKVDNQTIELEGGEQTTETFRFPTESGDAGHYTARVGPEDSGATQRFILHEPGPADLDLEVLSERDPVGPNENGRITVRVTNAGERTVRKPVTYRINGDGKGFGGSSTQQYITLAGGESTEVTLTTTAYSGAGSSNEYLFEDTTAETVVSIGDESRENRITLSGQNGDGSNGLGNFQLEVLAQENPIDRETGHDNVAGSVKVRVENIGDGTDEQFIMYDFYESNGNPNFGPSYYRGKQRVELAPSESDIITLEMEFFDLNKRLTGTATVYSDDDSISTYVEVIPPA